jgi:EAL domain-containing protein (putative c-di-GMP-specific phosphodiesterase class I)
MANARAALDQAIDGDNLVLLYQPIHDMKSHAIVSAEALLRQRRKSGELREASMITDAVEDAPHDTLIEFDEMMARRAYGDAARWQSNGGTNVHLHINLSPREFQEGDVVRRISALTSDTRIDTHKIHLEITEVSHIHDPGETADLLRSLKALGIELWLDDFGTGHSTLEHLYFPIDGVKIPSQFVRGIDRERRSYAITSSLIRMAHDLKLRVIAEGVERDEQLTMLAELECDLIQGFLFSRPMSVDDLIEKLATEAL